MYKLGSLFDGSGTCPLAASLCGMNPVWASEIEPYPIAVTASRFPNMKHLGSVTGIKGSEIEPVDIITFGSPCQDLSVAGLRKGIRDGERSNLFFEAIRIITEMRFCTNGKYPRFAVWENVPGAFSSNNGRDFHAVLQSFCEIAGERTAVPEPPKGKWSCAGCIVGDGYSVAWRTLDAQYWGVPQRRKRIYLVADFAGGSAGKILFESEGVSGYTPQGGEARQGAAAGAAGGVGAAGCVCLNDQALFVPKVYGICSKDSNAMKSDNPKSGFYEAETSRCLDANGGNPTCNQGGMAVAYCMTTGTYTQALEEQSPTLMARDYKDPPVVNETEPEYIVRRLTPTECARLQGFPDGWGSPAPKTKLSEEEIAFWESVRKSHAQANGKAYKPFEKTASLLRWYNKLHTDSAEYKMWGNGMALPCVAYVMQGIARALTLSTMAQSA